jgi:Tfp pilus assembly protein PilN
MENRKLIYLLWSVIGVLVLGVLVGGFLLIHHADEVDQTNTFLTGDNLSLKNQVKQLKATPSPTPTPTATPLATPEPSAAPTPKTKN